MAPANPVAEDLPSPDELDVLQQQVQYLTLDRGRKLAYYVIGDPGGRPVIYFHGSGSHIEGLAFHKAALKRNRMVIVPDRPGIGFSDYQKGRTWLDWVDDVTRLADALGLGRFSVVACSGGGPSLLACAVKIPERLDGVIDLACAGPYFRDPEMIKQLGAADRFYAKRGAKMPLWFFQVPFSLLGMSVKASKGPDAFLKLMKGSVCDADAEAAKDPDVAYYLWRDMKESFRQGSKGPAYDAQLIYKDWGFDPGEIQIPVHIYHGTDDRFVPLSFSERLTGALPKASLSKIEGEGHFYHLLHAGEVLDNLADAEAGR